MSGGEDGGSSTDIFQLDPETETWRHYGNMSVSRQKHAVELVNFADYSSYCQPPTPGNTGEFPSRSSILRIKWYYLLISEDNKNSQKWDFQKGLRNFQKFEVLYIENCL